jgi:predicted lysophospholipase L1 biosynthesis ABC-type transport system permease subunit
MTIALTGGLVTAAWRNFIRNLRRYRVLLVALVLIVMALTAVLGTILGLQGAVREKASRYFAGDSSSLATMAREVPSSHTRKKWWRRWSGWKRGNPRRAETAYPRLVLGARSWRDGCR